MIRKRVRAEADHIDHVVSYSLFFDGSAAAICGRKVWPGHWYEVPTGDTTNPPCAGCLSIIRGKR